MAATVVLVHGAWHGAWCWDRVLPLLGEAGIEAIAVDLPGHGESTEPLGDLASDAAMLRTTLADIDGPAVVCGHSYGGAVVAEGTDLHPAGRRVVFLTAFCLDPGESCTAAATDVAVPDTEATALGPALVFHDDATISLDPDRAGPALFHDCAPADIAWAVARLGPQASAELNGVATNRAWRELESTYVVCTEDRAVAPTLQRAMAQRCTASIEWPTSHSPFLSRPDLVAGLLVDLARQD